MDTDTITIIFPKVKVNTEIKDLTFDSIEDMILEISQHIARRVFEKAITDIDNYLHDKRKKYFLTRCGDILYARTRYKDRPGKTHYLLDDTLSISKNQRISLCRAQIEYFLATLSSYREVVNQARLLLGNFRSHESIRRGVIKEAKLIIENQKRKLQKIRNLEYQEVSPPDTAYLEADATFIKLQNKGKKKDKPSLEVKIGIGYTGKEDRYSTGKSQRLTHKFSLLSWPSIFYVFIISLRR